MENRAQKNSMCRRISCTVGRHGFQAPEEVMERTIFSTIKADRDMIRSVVVLSTCKTRRPPKIYSPKIIQRLIDSL